MPESDAVITRRWENSERHANTCCCKTTAPQPCPSRAEQCSAAARRALLASFARSCAHRENSPGTVRNRTIAESTADDPAWIANPVSMLRSLPSDADTTRHRDNSLSRCRNIPTHDWTKEGLNRAAAALQEYPASRHRKFLHRGNRRSTPRNRITRAGAAAARSTRPVAHSGADPACQAESAADRNRETDKERRDKAR